MELKEANWFIDACAVFDGIAFASFRAQDSEPEEIVSLHPPYWTPVPISSLALAGGAARRGFQEGFFSDDGDEIAFDDLEQVVEIVRRGYLSGGIDPGREMEPGLVPPPTVAGEPDYPLDIVERFIELYDEEPTALNSLFTEVLRGYNDKVKHYAYVMFAEALARAERSGDASAHAMVRAWARCTTAIPDGAYYIHSHVWNPVWNPWLGPDYGFPNNFLWKVALPVPIGRRVRTVGDVVMATGCSVEFVHRALSSHLGTLSFLFAHTVYDSLSAPPVVVGVNSSFAASVVTSILQMLPRRLDRKHAASKAMENLVAQLMDTGGLAVRSAAREDDEPMMLVTL
jgi:hypothetical protein